MTATRVLWAVVGSILIWGAIAGVFEDPNVKTLTDATLEDELKKHDHNLVVFYAPWCGYCKELSPKWSEVARELAGAKSSVLVAAIDADENQKSAEEYEIEGLPTIKWISSGEADGKLTARDYNGIPETKRILRWVAKLETGTPAPELKTEKDLEDSRMSQTSIIGVFDKMEGEAYSAFVEHALESEDDLDWFATTNRDLVGVDSAPTLVFSRNFSDTPLEVVRRPFARPSYDGRESPAEELAAFVDAQKHPDYYSFDASTISNMMETLEYVEREHHVHAIVPPRLLVDKAFLERAREAGRAIRDHAQLVLSVAGDDSEIKDAFHIKNLDDEVQVFVANTESIKKYAPSGPVKPDDFGVDLIKTIMDSIEKGEDTYRLWASAPVPEKETDENGVVTAVRSTLETIVGDQSKDVVVISYVPDEEDGAEDDFYLNIVRDLADGLKGIPSIRVVKFDGYANEHKLLEYSIEMLPAVTMFPANGDKKPILLEDPTRFSVKSIAEFIHEHAGVKFELPEGLPDEDGMFGVEDDDDLDQEFDLAKQLGLSEDALKGTEDDEGEDMEEEYEDDEGEDVDPSHDEL
jgi:protein disulfide-isomerase A1